MILFAFHPFMIGSPIPMLAPNSVDGRPGPTEFGASIGIGLPIMNGWNAKSIINISGQAVHVRPGVPGMITENYLRLNIGLSFNESWFDKWKVQ